MTRKSKVIPFPEARAPVPEYNPSEDGMEPLPEPVPLLDHPDVQVQQFGERYYRIRVGEVELTYEPTRTCGLWYLYLPGHKESQFPLTTDQYDSGDTTMINIDRDGRGIAVGIEVVGTKGMQVIELP